MRYTETQVRNIVADFAWQLLEDRLRQLGALLPGADLAPLVADITPDNLLDRVPPARQWFDLARYGARLTDLSTEAAIDMCQSLAEWLFSVPGEAAYDIPASWYESDLGFLWLLAFTRAQGDELITLTEAARIAGVSLSAIGGRISRGVLRAYPDPGARNPQHARRVLRSAVAAR